MKYTVVLMIKFYLSERNVSINDGISKSFATGFDTIKFENSGRQILDNKANILSLISIFKNKKKNE